MSETTHAGNTISPEQAAVEQKLVDTVVASFDKTEDPRLKEVMQSLTRHLHDFIREVRLTEDEWNTGIEFLTAAGHITDDKRQEFILLSDVLGAVHADHRRQQPGLQGRHRGHRLRAVLRRRRPRNPHRRRHRRRRRRPALLGRRHRHRHRRQPGPGRADRSLGSRRRRLLRRPVHRPAASPDAPTCSPTRTASTRSGASPPPRTRSRTTDRSAKCSKSAGRSPVRASHLHFMVTAESLRTLVTHIFVDGDPQIEIGDSVFGVKDSLIKRFEPQPAGTPTPDGRDLGNQAWARTRFDIVLAPAEV